MSTRAFGSEPGYVEAFPPLALLPAMSAWKRGRHYCIFTGEEGHDVGRAFILDLRCSENHPSIGVVTLYSIFDAGYLGDVANDECFRLRLCPSKVNPDRTYVECPQCAKPRAKIWFKGRWACAECHGLLRRSQLISRDVQLWERRNQLEVELRHGRPPGRHNSTFRAQQQELEEIRTMLKGRPRTSANAVHRHKIGATWISVHDPRAWIFRDDMCAETGKVVFRRRSDP